MIVPSDIADAILARCMGSPAAYAALGRLCDRVGGRVAGSEQGRLAEEWALDLFNEWGLHDVRYQEVPITAWERGTLEATVTGTAFWQLTAVAHGMCPAHADVRAPVVHAYHGDLQGFDRAGEAVRGSIVLCDEGASEGARKLHRTEKLAIAIERGAVGLMMMSSAPGGLPRTGVCHRAVAPIPAIGISKEDGERLLRLLAAGAEVLAHVKMTNSVRQGTARNVLADIPGATLPDEVVLAGGHLDSWDISQGATDNGLGSAIVLEMAHTLSSLPRRPARTLRFALWAAEEIGLVGSHHYCSGADLDKHVGVLNFDMTGDPFGYYIPGRPEPPSLLRGLVDQYAPLGMRHEYAHRAGLHSDHQPFMLAGVPVVSLLGKLPEEGGYYYHSVGDTFEKVSYGGLCRAAAVGAGTMWSIASELDRSFARFEVEQVRRMILDADLVDALKAEGYDGPAMEGL